MKDPIIIVLAVACALSSAGIAATHSQLQAVNPDGTSAWTGAFPVTLTGVLLCDPEEMLDSTPSFLPWNNGSNAGKMGGEWQMTFQAVEPGDRGGTTCWMGQNYANRVPPHDDQFSYANSHWVSEINRLNYDPETFHKFRAGDLVQVTANQALFFGGKRNLNEGHDVEPSANFTLSLITSNYGLPKPEVITLADILRPDDGDPSTSEDIFDPSRATGGERYQGVRVRIDGLLLVTTNGWNPANLWNNRKCTVTDGGNRFFTLRHPRYTLGPAPTGKFDAIGIFTQESGSGVQGTNGYELFVQQVIPGEPPALTIARELVIRWPAIYPEHRLEYRTNMNSTEYYAVTNAPVLVEGQKAVILDWQLPQSFFRLRKED
ncbi:MAG TPA: hypothetical protein VEC99_05400 [Clostridia bacterium]|nr:hypothetical protein [Clostridia bacterium]